MVARESLPEPGPHSFSCFSPLPPHPRPGAGGAAPPAFPGGIAGSAPREPGRRSSCSCVRSAREVRPAADGPGCRLLLLPVLPLPLHPLPLLGVAPALQIAGFQEQPRSGGGRSEGGGRSAAGGPR